MADDKMQMAFNEGKGKRFPWVGLSVFVLSILLSTTVAAVIYLSLHQSAACQQAAAETTNAAPDVSANVNVNVDDKHVKEKIEYSESRNIAFLYGSDGSFTAEDFGKGINIVKPAESSNCFVIPTGSNRTTSTEEIKTAISQYDGKEFSPEVERDNSQVLPGYITDVSFIPNEAKSQCSTYQWMAIIDKESAAEVGNSELLARQKRATRRCRIICVRYLAYNILTRKFEIRYRCYYYCYTIN